MEHVQNFKPVGFDPEDYYVAKGSLGSRFLHNDKSKPIPLRQ